MIMHATLMCFCAEQRGSQGYVEKNLSKSLEHLDKSFFKEWAAILPKAHAKLLIFSWFVMNILPSYFGSQGLNIALTFAVYTVSWIGLDAIHRACCENHAKVV